MKINIPAVLLSATALLAACSDYNDNFDGLKLGPQPTDVKKFDYTLTPDDYKAIATDKANLAKAKAAGEEAQLKALATTMKFTETITAAEYVPSFLYNRWFAADNGSAIRVSYDYKVTTGADAIRQDFETMEDKTVSPAVIDGWTILTPAGTANWEGRFFNKNNYLQASAYKQTGPAQTYAISPALAIEKGMTLTFDACYGNYREEGGRLSLFLLEGATDFSKADLATIKWTKDLTSSVKIPVPTETYGTLGNVAKIDLSAYAGKKVHLAFRYDGDGTTNATTTIQVDNVVVTNKVSAEGTARDQFVLANGKWSYDPSATINLYPTRNDVNTVAYFTAGVEWVKENIDAKLGLEAGKGYVTSYGNNEYYSGLSYYYGNVDVRAGKAREQYAKGYEGMDDAAVTALMEKRLQETLAGALAKLHPDVAPIEGIDVIYTLRIGVYTGTTLAADQVTHTISFRCVAPGKFEYVEGSYQAI
ncbi:MAG: choice-of-anchor J domain-containing protein [Bacteroidaceae bacterium]|nr:choice-of-anchor J domain-containing protein [Bacteroidaceae bacterium]